MILNRWQQCSQFLHLFFFSLFFLCHRYCEYQWWHIEANAIHWFYSSPLGVYGCNRCPQAQQQRQIRAAECQPQSRVTCSKGMMRWPADRQLWLWGQPDWGTHRHAISHRHMSAHTHILNMETIAGTEWMLDNITHLENQWHWRCKAWIELKSAKPR